MCMCVSVCSVIGASVSLGGKLNGNTVHGMGNGAMVGKNWR